ncbi:MAG TPA: hypothetical protein VNU73_07540, partial [Steroidobacteraceae bacterium]|nr:hypothetical protein [Steroidobacteraceae bacterium]
MDFYAYQAAARRQTRILVVAFVVALAAVVVALDVVLFTVLAAREGGPARASALDYAARHPGAAVAWSLLVLG